MYIAFEKYNYYKHSSPIVTAFEYVLIWITAPDVLIILDGYVFSFKTT